MGLRADGKAKRMEIFIKIENPDSASAQSILEQINKLFSAAMPNKSEPASYSTTTTSTTTTSTYMSKFSSYIPTQKISNVISSTTSVVASAVNSVTSTVTGNFYANNKIDEVDIKYVWIPKFGILYYKTFDPVVEPAIPLPTSNDTLQTLNIDSTPESDLKTTQLTTNENNNQMEKIKKYKEICYEFDSNNTKWSEKLLDPNISLDEKIGLCAGILVGNFSKIPFSQSIAQALAGKLAQIFLRAKL